MLVLIYHSLNAIYCSMLVLKYLRQMLGAVARQFWGHVGSKYTVPKLELGCLWLVLVIHREHLSFVNNTYPPLLVCLYFALQAREPTVKVLFGLLQPFVSFFIVLQLLVFIHIFNILLWMHYSCWCASKKVSASRK